MSTLVADFLYLVVTLISFKVPTFLYWITVFCDVLLVIFTILGVLTTLRDVDSLNDYLYPKTDIEIITNTSNFKDEEQKEGSKPSCPDCSAEVNLTSAFCSKCGRALKEN